MFFLFLNCVLHDVEGGSAISGGFISRRLLQRAGALVGAGSIAHFLFGELGKAQRAGALLSEFGLGARRIGGVPVGGLRESAGVGVNVADRAPGEQTHPRAAMVAHVLVLVCAPNKSGLVAREIEEKIAEVGPGLLAFVIERTQRALRRQAHRRHVPAERLGRRLRRAGLIAERPPVEGARQ